MLIRLSRSFALAVVVATLAALCTWMPRAEAAGAIIDDPGCATSSLPANDDGSSAAVDLPFTVGYAGASYDQAYVNNNGSITFDEPSSELTGPPDAGSPPVIAPFWSDVDTRASGSGIVTWGTTTFQGRQAFCVNWLDVGYFPVSDDRLNRFQLLLVDMHGFGPPGAFNVVFAYDQIQWDQGGDAWAGLGDGTGGTIEVAGSRTAGAFLDDDPNGLVHRAQGSFAATGQLIFPVWDDGPPTPGSITIIERAHPQATQDFAFQTTGTAVSPFTLDDDANATLSNTRTFDGLGPGTYTFTQGVVRGWVLRRILCTTSNGSSTVTEDTAAGRATVVLAQSDDVRCTFHTWRPRPDALITGSSGRSYIGDNVYENPTSPLPAPLPTQNVTEVIRAGSSTDFYVRLQNDAPFADRLGLGLFYSGSPRISVTVFRGTADITDAVTSDDGLLLPALNPGSMLTVRVHMAMGRSAPSTSTMSAWVQLWGPGTRVRDVVRARANRA